MICCRRLQQELGVLGIKEVVLNGRGGARGRWQVVEVTGAVSTSPWTFLSLLTENIVNSKEMASLSRNYLPFCPLQVSSFCRIINSILAYPVIRRQSFRGRSSMGMIHCSSVHMYVRLLRYSTQNLQCPMSATITL